MRTLSRIGLVFLIFVAFLPTSGAECPPGTRNNYKGDCISAAPPKEDTETHQEEKQKWDDPTQNSSVVEELEVHDPAGEGADDDSKGAVVVVEEVVTVDEDVLSDADIEESLSAPSASIESANTLSTIQQFREEISDLLNRVELQRYELEKLRSRQIDLYDDLDQRLRKRERLALTVPMPVTPLPESIAILQDANSSTEPAPIVAGKEPLSWIAGANAQDVTEGKVTIETQGVETPVVAVITESVVGVPEPAPMVVGIGLPVPSVDSGAVIIVQPRIPIEEQDQEIQAEPVVVEEMDEEVTATVAQMTTIVVGPSETKAGEGVITVGTPTMFNAQEKQPDSMQIPSIGVEFISVAPTGSPTEEQAAVMVTTAAPNTVTLSEQGAYDQAFNLLKQSRYDDAAEEFASFLRQYRNSQLTDDAWYWMAEAHYVTREFKRALIAFDTLVNYFENSPRIPASRLKIGYIQYELANYEGARQTLRQLLRDFPTHRVAVSADTRLKKMDREGR